MGALWKSSLIWPELIRSVQRASAPDGSSLALTDGGEKVPIMIGWPRDAHYSERTQWCFSSWKCLEVLRNQITLKKCGKQLGGDNNGRGSRTACLEHHSSLGSCRRNLMGMSATRGQQRARQAAGNKGGWDLHGAMSISQSSAGIGTKGHNGTLMWPKGEGEVSPVTSVSCLQQKETIAPGVR